MKRKITERIPITCGNEDLTLATLECGHEVVIDRMDRVDECICQVCAKLFSGEVVAYEGRLQKWNAKKKMPETELPKYARGRLHIVGFDQLGAKLFSLVSPSDNYVKTIQHGNYLIAQGECSSFCLMRIMYNSAAAHGQHSNGDKNES
jgi:hypothetical protein